MVEVKLGKLIRVGTSLAIVIPKTILRATKLERGDRVAFGVYDENVIAIRRVSPDELLKLRPDQVEF